MSENSHYTQNLSEEKTPQEPYFDLEQLEEAGIPVRRSWFDAYTRSNSMWPQTFAAISFYTVHAVLNEPPVNAQEWLSSNFSQEQLEVLGKKMSAVHHTKNIHHATSPHSNGNDLLVQDWRLQQLWRHAKYVASKRILRAINNTPEQYKAGAFISQREYEKLDNFFVNSQTDERFNLMCNVANYAQELFSSPVGQSLSRSHRYHIHRLYQRKTDQEEGHSLLSIATPYELKMLRYVRDNLMNSFPEDQIRWLTN